MNRSTLQRFVLAGLLALLAASPAQAKKKPFNVDINVGGQQAPTAGFSSVTDTVDYLDSDGKPLCPCAGTTAPSGWFYKRVWAISTLAGSTNLKQITVTSIVARSVGKMIVPRATVTALRSRVGNE